MPDPRAAGRMAHPSIDRCCRRCYFAESILENHSPNSPNRFPSTKEAAMAQLKGSKTHENLKAAFAGESQANRRYLYFAKQADVEGQNDVSALFRSTAEGETGHAHGHLEYLEAVGDPATNLPIGRTRHNLNAAVAG